MPFRLPNPNSVINKIRSSSNQSQPSTPSQDLSESSPTKTAAVSVSIPLTESSTNSSLSRSPPVQNLSDPFRLSLPKIDTRLYSDSNNSEVSSLVGGSSPSSPVTGSNFARGFSPLKAPKMTSPDASSSIYSGNGHRRTLSDRTKATPASFVRHLRIYSLDGPNLGSPNALVGSLNGRLLLLQNKVQTQDLPPELSPIVNLINAQRLRTYAIGSFQIPAVYENETAWIEVEAKLTGSELAVWRPSTEEFTLENGNNEFKPKYINLIDFRVEVCKGTENQIKIYQDFQDENTVLIQFNSRMDLNDWVSAIFLSKFEYNSLNEAFTAVMLSLKGSKLADIHVLLSLKKRFAKYEWCNLRLPQISSKWLKVYVCIFPSDNKKKGRIEIYTSEKMTKKNLMVYIPNLTNAYNVYPEQANMIDVNSIMKLNGEIHVNKQYAHLFTHHTQSNNNDLVISSGFGLDPPASPSIASAIRTFGRSESNSSLSSVAAGGPPVTPYHTHSKSLSVASTTSFFNNGPTPTPDDHHSKKLHRRTFSGASASSTSQSGTPEANSPKGSSFFKKNMSNFVTAEYLYLMPVSHPGVPAIETMIRNYFHIIDAYKLYGRPKKMISEKTDPGSLLFGLPSLPHYQYLSIDDVHNLAEQNINECIEENWTEFEWSRVFKEAISVKYKNPKKIYKGHGDIGKLYSNLDIDYDEIASPSALKVASNEYDSFYESLSPPISQHFSDGALGEPISLAGGRQRAVSSPLSNAYPIIKHENDKEEEDDEYEVEVEVDSDVQTNSSRLKLNNEDVNNYKYETLAPIVDMPTPVEELHPYKNMIDLILNDGTAKV